MKLVLHFIFNIAWLWPAEYQAGQSTLWALVSYLEYLNARNHFNFNKWIVLNVILLICKKSQKCIYRKNSRTNFKMPCWKRFPGNHFNLIQVPKIQKNDQFPFITSRLFRSHKWNYKKVLFLVSAAVHQTSAQSCNSVEQNHDSQKYR